MVDLKELVNFFFLFLKVLNFILITIDFSLEIGTIYLWLQLQSNSLLDAMHYAISYNCNLNSQH